MAAEAAAGGDGAGCGTAAAAVAVVVGVDDSVLEDAWSTFGAVEARFGGDDVAAGLLLLLGVDIRHFVWHTHTRHA